MNTTILRLPAVAFCCFGAVWVLTATPLTSAAAETANQAGSTTAGVQMRFRNAPLSAVLDYFGEAAGFTFVREVDPHGNIDLWCDEPLSPEEALDLLNGALLQNGYATIRQGQTLTLINRDEARTRRLPVKVGSNPALIPDNNEMVTQIMAIRFVQATTLAGEIRPLVSSFGTMTANDSANALVITDVQRNIRRLAQLIQALDLGSEDYMTIRVIALQNADAQEMTGVLAELFPDETGTQANAVLAPNVFGGPPGSFTANAATAMSGAASASSQRLQKATKVTAVADERTSSIVVIASKNIIEQVEAVVRQLDGIPAGKQRLHVIQLKNASPQRALSVLQDLFQKDQGSTANSSQTDALEARSSNYQQATTARSSGLGGESGMSNRRTGSSASGSGIP